MISVKLNMPSIHSYSTSLSLRDTISFSSSFSLITLSCIRQISPSVFTLTNYNTHHSLILVEVEWYINLGKYEIFCESLPLIEAPHLTTKTKDDSSQKMQLIFITMVGCNIFGIIVMFFLFSIREWEVKEEMMREKYSSQRTIRTRKAISDIFEDLINEDEVLLSSGVDSSFTKTKSDMAR